MQKDIYILATDTCYGIACSVDDIKSYEKIYKMKKRSFDQPLAVMVPDFAWLEEHTQLSEDQISVLKNYPGAFTILCECPALHALIHFEERDHFYKNKDVYDKIALRVAHTPEQKKLISKTGPIFLTSANLSGHPELYTIDDVEDTFSEYEHLIHTLSKYDLNQKNKASDIFEFIDDSTEIAYLRQYNTDKK